MDKPVGSLKATNWDLFKTYWDTFERPTLCPPCRETATVDLILGADRADLLTPLIVRQGSARCAHGHVYTVGMDGHGPLYPEEAQEACAPELCVPLDLDNPGEKTFQDLNSWECF